MTTVFDAKTGNMTILDRNGKPRVKLGTGPDWISLEDKFKKKFNKASKLKPFKQPPNLTGYTSLIGLHSDYQVLQDLPEIPDLFLYAAEITDRIVGFGNTNIDYILSNLKDYKYLLNKLRYNPQPYRLALTQLISINVYREYNNEPYNLPTILNRSQIEQRYNLLEYLNKSKLTY